MGLGSEIRDPEKTYSGSQIPDPGVKKAPDPGSRIPDPQHCFLGRKRASILEALNRAPNLMFSYHLQHFIFSVKLFLLN